MVGIRSFPLGFGLFSGAMLVLGRVNVLVWLEVLKLLNHKEGGDGMAAKKIVHLVLFVLVGRSV